jgi:hypothetical protein
LFDAYQIIKDFCEENEKEKKKKWNAKKQFFLINLK